MDSPLHRLEWQAAPAGDGHGGGARLSHAPGGGTASAAVHLLEKIGAKILEVHFLIELEFLQGRKKLKGYPVKSLLTY